MNFLPKFQLLTGWSFCSLFPSGLQSHTPLTWNNDPDLREGEAFYLYFHLFFIYVLIYLIYLFIYIFSSGEAEFRDLITKLLQHLPEMRLTKSKEIKSHRFFVGINWKT